MAFSSPTGDIPVQPAAGALLFLAGAAITKGNAVYISADNTVSKTASSGARAVGIAAYTQATVGDPIAIYGPGNLVQAFISGASAGAAPIGTIVGGFNDGMISYPVDATYNMAIVVKGNTSPGAGQILIY